MSSRPRSGSWSSAVASSRGAPQGRQDRRSARCGSAVLALLPLLAAGPQPPPQNPGDCKPPPIEVFLQADPDLNRNELGQPMPVEVRVLLLKDRERLDNADFETVWKDTANLLGKDLVNSASLTVFPGKLKIYPMKSAPGVAYVALVGLFRRPEGQGWRYVVDVRETNKRCAAGEELHSIVHALLRRNRIVKPD
jgi:type VI secretion system VasD/TssJ family lipoprotein